MNFSNYLDIHPDVENALKNKEPIVALESTIISHGMPYPKNVETALTVVSLRGGNPSRAERGVRPILA